jgi:hypothetical protein
MDEKRAPEHEGSGSEDSSSSRRSSERPKPETLITPVGVKIGEDRGNLQQRSDWFQRRSGGPR